MPKKKRERPAPNWCFFPDVIQRIERDLKRE